MAGIPAARTSFGRAVLVCSFLVVVVNVDVALASLPWEASGGRWPAAGIAFLALLAARPLLDRFSRRIGGVDGPRVFWRAMIGVAPVLAFGVIDAFWSSFHFRAPFAFGGLAMSSIDHLLPYGIALGAAAGLVLERIGGFLVRTRWDMAEERFIVARAFAAIIAIGAAAAILPLVAKTARGAPTAQAYLASMECVGPLPGVTPPKTPPDRPATNPTDAQAYPYVFPQNDAARGWHATRYCDNTTCVVYAAPEKDGSFPPVFDSSRFPRRTLSDYVDPGDAVDVCSTFRVVAMRSKRGMREWTTMGDRFEHIYDPREVTHTLAAPWSSLVCAAIALAVAAFVAWRPRKDGLRAAGLAGDWVPGTLGADGLVRFDDGTPPARAEGTPFDGPVLVVLRAGSAASFRDAGAPTVTLLFRGTRDDLDAHAATALGAEPAFAAAAAALSAALIVAGLYMGLG